LLAIGRVESGVAGEESTLRLDTLVRDRVAATSAMALRRSIELVVSAPDAVTVRGDPALLASIVDNLVDNAGRYVPAGGRVEIDLHEDAEDIVLAVRDNGLGVAGEFRDRVFERFFRVPGSDESGSGLGLAIVRAIATSLGGSAGLIAGLEGRGFGVEVRLPKGRLSVN
jgi:signal transduction histidine kinase